MVLYRYVKAVGGGEFEKGASETYPDRSPSSNNARNRLYESEYHSQDQYDCINPEGIPLDAFPVATPSLRDCLWFRLVKDLFQDD